MVRIHEPRGGDHDPQHSRARTRRRHSPSLRRLVCDITEQRVEKFNRGRIGGASLERVGSGDERFIVFTNDDEVPPELRGINDEETFRALVSCLVSEKKNGKKISTVNVTTAPFPATPTGDADIDAQVQLPADCVAPIIFIISGSEEHWFAVTGAETS